MKELRGLGRAVLGRRGRTRWQRKAWVGSGPSGAETRSLRPTRRRGGPGRGPRTLQLGHAAAATHTAQR